MDTDVYNYTISSQSLTDIAHNHVKSNRPCLEPCLRRLSKHMESLGVGTCIWEISGAQILIVESVVYPFISLLIQSRPPQPPPSLQPQSELERSFGRLDDDRIPFPCTAGARFCSNGNSVSLMHVVLVCMR